MGVYTPHFFIYAKTHCQTCDRNKYAHQIGHMYHISDVHICEIYVQICAAYQRVTPAPTHTGSSKVTRAPDTDVNDKWRLL